MAAVVLLVPPLSAAACAEREPAAKPPVRVPASPSPRPVPLTPDVAEQAFRTYVTDEDVARAAADERLALNWTSDGQAQLVAAEFREAIADGDPIRRFSYGDPKLYVPKMEPDVFPQWFVASVPRGVQGEKKSTRTALMAFVLRSASDRWKLTLTTLLAPKAKEPKVELDADGYATALETEDSSVLIRPREVGGIQATIAAEGGGSVAAKVMKSGRVTTGYYQATRKAEKKAREKDLKLQIVYTATPFPYFALRTQHGGGLVLYALFRNTKLTSKDPRERPSIPPEAAHLLDGTVEGPDIYVSATLQFAAFDPPRAKKDKPQPKADIIADDGAVTKASAPPATS